MKKTAKKKAPAKRKAKPAPKRRRRTPLEVLTKKLEELGGQQFAEEEIATSLGLGKLTDAHRKAIARGRLKAESEVRKKILALAKKGTATAQTHYLALVARNAPPRQPPAGKLQGDGTRKPVKPKLAPRS